MREAKVRVVYRLVCVMCVCLCSPCSWGQVASTVFEQSGFADRGYAGFSILPGDEPRRFQAIPDVVTPHVPWGKPLTGRPLRVLAIAHRHAGRWPVELLQRFDLELKVVYGGKVDDAGPPHSGYIGQHRTDVQARVLQAMNEPVDVLISDISIPALGDRVQERLAELLGRGVGYIGRTEGLELGSRARAAGQEKDIVASTVPVAGLRLMSREYGSIDKAAGQIVKMWESKGAGRIANPWDYPRDDAMPDPDRLQYPWLISMEQEAWCLLVGRLVFWAARRMPAKSAAFVDWPAEAIDREDLPFALSLSTGPRKDASLTVRVWDADGRLRHRGTDLSIPVLPVGRYFVGVQLVSGDDVRDWSIGTLSVRSAVDIAGLDLDSRFKRRRDKIRANVTLSAGPPKGSRLHLEVVDNFGRCVAREHVDAAKTVAFEAGLLESLHMYNYVNVRLSDAEGQVLAETRSAFFIAQPRPAPDDLSWVVWAGCPLHPRQRNHVRRLAEMGMAGLVNGAHHGATEKSVVPVQAAAVHNAHSILYVTHLYRGVRVKDGVRRPCITDSRHLANLKARLSKQAEFFADYVPLAYTLGDDQRYSRGHDLCWSPSCRAGLAAFAKAKYGTIEAVNRAWTTAYERFDQIEPIKRAEGIEAARRTKDPDYGPLCHWIDRQLYADTTVAEWHGQMAAALRVADPRQPVGFDCTNEGWQAPATGFDFWQLAKRIDLLGQYYSPIVHTIYRSARRPGAYQITWYGGYGIYGPWPYHDHDFLPWWYAFNGVNLHGLWGLIIVPYPGERLLAPDLGLHRGPAMCLDNVRELQSGIAKLMFNAKRAGDGVAILYSTASLHAVAALPELPKEPGWSTLGTGATRFTYNQSWEGFAQLVTDVGLSYEVVPTSHLEKGLLAEKGLRLLVLPLALRITDREARAIRRFVRSGGVLIADAFPGVLNGQCRANQSGVLADVFGVKFAGGIPGQKRVAREPAAMADGRQLGQVVADCGISLTGATALGKTHRGAPIFLVHKFGEGRAILLNVMARDYQIWRSLATELPFRKSVTKLLEAAGIRPSVRTQVPCLRGKVTPLQATEWYRYELDGGHYVGLLRHGKLRPDETVYMADQRPKPLWITFDRAAHVYDVRRRTYRGFTDKINDMVYPARAKFFALLPYEVRDLKLQTEQKHGAVFLKGQIVPGDPGAAPITHVFHVEVTDPDGRIRRELVRNTVAKVGRFRERFFLGYNARPGPWQFSVRDVASGMARSASVQIAGTRTSGGQNRRPHASASN